MSRFVSVYDRVRDRNVRVEAEPRTRIVHNYGHGGSGVTLSWGCATEVADLVERLVRGDGGWEASGKSPRPEKAPHPGPLPGGEGG